MEPDSLSFLTLITKLRVIPCVTFGVRCSENPPANFEIKSVMNFEFQNDVHFSSTEHQKADWLGIHEKICQLLIPLRTPIPFLGSEEDRQHRKQQQIVRQVCDY